MKMVFWGHNNYGEEVLKYFIKKGYNIPLIITPSNDFKKTESLKSLFSTDVNIISILEYNEDEIIKKVEEINPDVMLSCSFKYKIPNKLLNISGKKIINIHGALLPKYRGANMLNWLIIEGSDHTGVTLHYMAEELDSGDILAEIRYPIYFEDDAVSLKNRMFEKTIELFDTKWDKIIKGEIIPQKQDHSQAYYFPGRKPSDGLINWNTNAIKIYNLVRALVNPFPGAFTFYNNKKIIIDKTEIIYDNKVSFKPGKVINSSKHYIIVSTLYNKIKITKAHFECNNENIEDFSIFIINTFFAND